jgi:hypothetical protein
LPSLPSSSSPFTLIFIKANERTRAPSVQTQK